MRRLARLFSFRGRTTRIGFWRAYAPLLVLFAGAWVAILRVYEISLRAGDWLMLVLVPILIAIIAVVVRRLHDRARSGWWAIPFQIAPFLLLAFANYLMCCGETTFWSQACIFCGSVLAIWGFIEIGLLPSKPGPSRGAG